VVVCAAFGVATHFLGSAYRIVSIPAAFSPLFVALAALSAVVLGFARSRVPAAVALIVTVAGVAAQLPLFVGADRPEAVGATVRLMQANLGLGGADAGALVHRLRADRVDLLTVAELTPAAAARLAAAGVAESLPFSYLRPASGGGGGGIFSRYPLTDGGRLPGLLCNNVRATLAVPGAVPVAVYALHAVPPYPSPSRDWARELDQIGAILAEEPLPLLVGADFNSTYDHKRYRDVLRGGAKSGSALLDAAEYLGSGIVATFPAHTWYPALLAIDRVLARGATPVSFHRVDLPGSDHYGVTADVLLPTE
jgi:endonuclease/exonuclease/phosphatase (EEP) superfamily protein YafD